MRTALVVGLVAILCCARQQRAPATAIPDGGGTLVKVLMGGRSCLGDFPLDETLAANIRAETPALVAALRGRGVLVADPIVDPSKEEVDRAAAPVGGRPLIVIYSGHGQLAEPGGRVLSDNEAAARPHRPLRSVICTRNGPLAIDDLVRNFRAPTPGALFIANACFSAHVDLRAITADVSVLSGSTEQIAASTFTPIGRRLTSILAGPLDCDGDAAVSDFEIFSPVERGFSRGGGNPDPKLRRQLNRQTAFFRSASAAECPTAAPALDSTSQEYFYRGRKRLRFPGRFSARPAGLVPPQAFSVPCSDPVGHCFDVSPRPPS